MWMKRILRQSGDGKKLKRALADTDKIFKTEYLQMEYDRSKIVRMNEDKLLDELAHREYIVICHFLHLHDTERKNTKYVWVER